jgi:cell division GTPase FtsZ
VDFAGDEVTVEEVNALMQVIYGSLNDETLVSFADTPDPNLRDQLRVTLIAEGT